MLFLCTTLIFAAASQTADAKTYAMACAKAKTQVSAAPAFSASSVMIAKGGSQKVTLKNGKGSWTIGDEGVAKIKSRTAKSVTLVPVGAGSTTLTCRVGKRELSCKVRVLNDRIGTVRDTGGVVVQTGKSKDIKWFGPKGMKLKNVTTDKGLATVKVVDKRTKNGAYQVTIRVRARKPGLIPVSITCTKGGETFVSTGRAVGINGFRGSKKAARNAKNYRAWRRETITNLASADLSTWEMVDAIGSLICSGRYSGRGGSSGMQLWYGGNGTCVSGAKMMRDFMNDMGVSNRIHHMSGRGGAMDINGWRLYYTSGHRNTWIRLGGKVYELNPQPGVDWPLGIIPRKKL